MPNGEYRMARPQLNSLMIAVALLPIACDRKSEDAARGPIIVKLPPARQQTPAPSFSFKPKGDFGSRTEPPLSEETVRRPVR